jgi:hypothetical protein
MVLSSEALRDIDAQRDILTGICMEIDVQRRATFFARQERELDPKMTRQL